MDSSTSVIVLHWPALDWGCSSLKVLGSCGMHPRCHRGLEKGTSAEHGYGRGNDYRKIEPLCPWSFPKIRLFNTLAALTWVSIFSSENWSFSTSSIFYEPGSLRDHIFV